MQREGSKGGSLALSSQVKSGEDILECEKINLEKIISNKLAEVKNNTVPQNNILNTDKKILIAENKVKNAQEHYDENKLTELSAPPALVV